LGIKIKAKEIIDYSSHVYNEEKHIILIAFICEYLSGEIKKIEINDYTWLSLNEMKDYDITEADLSFIEKLKP